MSTNYKVAVWERDCEKKQEQFLARIYAGKIKRRQGEIIMLIFGAIMFAACAAGPYLTKEYTQLFTQVFSFCFVGLSLTFLLSEVLIENKRQELEGKALKEYDRQYFYKSYEEGLIKKIKYIQDHTVIYEIKSSNNSTFNWTFTVDKVEQVDGIDTYIIHVTDDIVKICSIIKSIIK